MTSIPAPAVPRRYLVGYHLGRTLQLLPATIALTSGTVWVLLLAALLFSRRR